jgi:hypothetical protein
VCVCVCAADLDQLQTKKAKDKCIAKNEQHFQTGASQSKAILDAILDELKPKKTEAGFDQALHCAFAGFSWGVESRLLGGGKNAC